MTEAGSAKNLYQRHWGEVAFSYPVTLGPQAFDVLTFPSRGPIARLATSGLAGCGASGRGRLGVELLMVVGIEELERIGERAVCAFVADVAVHVLGHPIRQLGGSTIPRTTLAPWPPDAILFDQPLGEPPELSAMSLPGGEVRLVWAVPIYAAEAALIADEGLEAFDALPGQSDFSLADVLRPSFVEWPR